MARISAFDDVAEAAGAISTKARRAARAATSDTIRAAGRGQDTARSVFHDLAEEAEERMAAAEKASQAFGAIVSRQARERPVLTVVAVVATAALAASFAGWVLSRR